MFILIEDSRNQLVAKSKTAAKERDGKTRYQKRVKSRVASSVRQFNRMDMTQLFKDNILTLSIEVYGETDNYLVKLSFGGILDALHSELKRNEGKLDLRNIIKSIVIAFNKNDVYVHCSCPDFKYRFAYWATVNKTSSGEPELIPSDETNPDDTLGPACKHVLLVLSNSSWIVKAASVIYNYINYMEKYRQKQYADIIYPAIYGKKYEEPVQQNIFSDDSLESEETDIDISNKYATTKSQFKTGNPYRFTRQETTDDQETMFDKEANDGE